MKTVSGILVLGKKEQESLRIIKQHSMADVSYGSDGSFNKEGRNGEFPFDQKEAEKARRGWEVIDFILSTQK